MLSAATAVEIVARDGWDMDAFVHVSRGDAVGINGCTLVLRRVDPRERLLDLSVYSDWTWEHGLTLVVVVPSRMQHEQWTVIVNGRVSKWTGIQLGIGVNIFSSKRE